MRSQLNESYPIVGTIIAATLSRNELYRLPKILHPYFGEASQLTRTELMAPSEVQAIDRLSKLRDFSQTTEGEECWIDQIDEHPLDPVPYAALSRVMKKGETRCFPYYPEPLSRVELCLVALNVLPESIALLLALKDLLTELMLDGERLHVYHPSIGQFRSWFSRIPVVSSFMAPMSPVIGQLSQMMTDVYGLMMGRSEVLVQMPDGEWVDAEDVGSMISRISAEHELALSHLRHQLNQVPLPILQLTNTQLQEFET